MTYDRRTASIPRLEPAVRKAIKGLKQNLKELEETLAGDSDGKWDPMQGISEDLKDDTKKLLQAVKAVNKYRSSRNDPFMR